MGINESLDGTRWGGESGEKITLRDVLEYFKVNNIMPKGFDTQDLFYKLSGGKEVLNIIEKGGEESNKRVEAASLDYPIIVVMRDGDIEYVLDGNHRLQKAKNMLEKEKRARKAKNNNFECIQAYVLDLDDPRIPESYKMMF